MIYYRIFELQPSYNLDRTELKKSYKKLSKEKHPDMRQYGDEEERKRAEKEYSEINEAYITLSNEEKRLSYLLKELEIIGEEDSYQLEPEFLMEMMELNELKIEDEAKASQMLESKIENAKNSVQDILQKEDWNDLSLEEKNKLREYYYQNKYLYRASGT